MTPWPERGRRRPGGGAAAPAAARSAADRRRRELAALNAVAAAVGRAPDLGAAATATLEVVCGLLGAETGALYRLDPGGERLTLVAARGFTAEMTAALRERPVSQSLLGQAVRSGRLSVADLGESPVLAPELRALAERLGLRTQITLPLEAGGRVWGAFAVATREGRRVSAGDTALLEAVARQVGLAVERAELLDQARQRAAEYRALFEVGNLVGATLEAPRVLDLIVDRCRAVMGVAAAGIFRLDPATGWLAYERGVGLSPEFIQHLRVRLGEGTSGRAAAERVPVWSADLLADAAVPLSPATRRLVEGEGYRSVLSVPILSAGAAYGALAVYWWDPHTPTPAEVELLSGLATQAGVALENARLFGETRTTATRLRALGRLGEIVSSSLDLDEVLQAVVRAAGELMGAVSVVCWVADETAQALEVRAVSDPAVHADFPSARVAFGEGVAGGVAERRQPEEVPDVFADPRVLSPGWWRAHGLRSLLCVPIQAGPSLLGVLSLCGRGPFRLGPEDRELLDAFVAQAAAAIRNARLFARTARRLEETRALLEVAEILNSTLEPRRLLREVAIKIAQVCRVDRCSIERWDDDQVIPLMSQFADGRRDARMWRAFTAPQAYTPREVPAYRQVLETRQPVVVADAVGSGLIPRDWVEAFAHRALLLVPLLRQAQVLGVMMLDYCERPGTFEPWQVDLAAAVAGQLALSIENARLYAQAQERLAETATLFAVSQAVSQPGPPADMLRRAAREVARAFGADMVGVLMLDEAREALSGVTGYRVPPDLRDWFQTHPLRLARTPGLVEAWSQGRALWSADARNDPRLDPEWLGALPPHSVLFVPTRVRGETVGALVLVWWATGREFPPGEVRLAEAVAGQVGLALENADLSRQTQQKLQETETLLAVSQALSTSLDPDTLMRQLLRHVVRALDADAAGVWLLDEATRLLHPVTGYRVPRERLAALRDLRLSVESHPFYAEAARTGRTVVTTDAMADPRMPEAARAVLPHASQVFVPVLVRGRMLGGVGLVWWTRRREVSAGEARLLEAVASQAGVALENARLFQDNRRRLQELSVLHDLSRAVTGRLDQAALLQALREQAARVVDARNMVVLLHDRERQEFQVALAPPEGALQEGLPSRYPARGIGLASVVLASRSPLRTTDYALECVRRRVTPVPGPDLPHYLGVPIAVGDEVFGVLALRGADRAFTEADERVLSSIADLVALALRSARLYEERSRAYGELAAAQEQLVRSEKLRALGEMASGVAHDFNNVLASILGRAQLLLQEVRDPRLRRWLEVIERAGMDGARTVRRLQEFTRIRRDQPVVPVDLNRVVAETLEATEPRWRDEARARGGTIEVVTRLAPELPPVAGDPAELREALTNLILNAVDAMPRGGTLSLATLARGPEVDLVVQDTGVGMSEEVRQRIFDPFFTTKGPRGTGLGLSMAYGILSRHGAQVSVESQEGRGSTFRLTFPRTDLTPPPAEPGPAGPARGLRCLVVDDEEAVGEMLGDVLASRGHTAVVVRDGEAALARFDGEPFDVVFTDLSMPGMSGWEVARALRARRPDVPVLLVTGFGAEVPAEDAEAHGVRAVLAKPLRIEDVQAALAGLAQPAGGQAPAGGREGSP